ncbi:MAG: hypothetical protein AB7I50_14880 [Vicinamibacterales bacterium]
MKDRLLALAACAAFIVLATANAGGYRFGVSDQAFYIPAVLQHLDASAFPRDRTLIDGQAHLLVFDELLAWLSRVSGISLEWLFFWTYALTASTLAMAYWRLSRAFKGRMWTSVAFLAAMTLRHRVTATGVNTFEGYFHPRMLAFALGLLAAGCTLRQRPIGTSTLLACAILVHPTTALWFATWLGAAWLLLATRDNLLRIRVLVVSVAFAGALIAAWLWLYGERMDPEWSALLASKDYVFPLSQWPWRVWSLHGLTLALLFGIFHWRRQHGMTTAFETSCCVGLGVLVGAFVLSLAFNEHRVALAVQLQTSRVLWLVEIVATWYLVWAICGEPAGVRRPTRAAAVALTLAVASFARGAYIIGVERGGQPLVQTALPRNEWTDALQWMRANTPLSAHVLADPGHAWKYGTSVRVGAQRDVFFEEVKDVAMALYSRDAAARALTRIRALPALESSDRQSLESLTTRFRLDYVVGERILMLTSEPIWHNERFAVWSLRSEALR